MKTTHRLCRAFVLLGCGAFGATSASGQGHVLAGNQPALTTPPPSFAAAQYLRDHDDQALLRQMWMAQLQRQFNEEQLATQQAAQQSMANAEVQRQQIINGFRNAANGQTISQAFSGLQQSTSYSGPSGYGYVDGGGFWAGAGYQGQGWPQAGMMPLAGQGFGGGQPQAGDGVQKARAPQVPFEDAQAMKARAFDTDQRRADLARQKAAKKKAPTRKAATAKKAPAPKPASEHPDQ